MKLEHKFFWASLLCALLFCTTSRSQTEKGIWLTDVASTALDSPEGIAKVIQDCKRYGLEHIYVVVWNRGQTLYPSAVMDRTFGRPIAPRFQGKDVLKELIDKAHQENIKVHAWFEFGFSSSYMEADGGHILRAKPHWKAVDAQGNLVSKNGFQWMNAFHPEVQDFLIALVLEVVQTYEVDGIQGDDRLPANPSTAGYDTFTLGQYALDHDGNLPPEDHRNVDWVSWRADRLTHFAGRLYRAVKATDPQVRVSMAPSIYPWSKEEYLQDWPAWVQQGWVDAIHPQVYRYDIKAYKRTLRTNLELMPLESEVPFVPGILLRVDDYTPTDRFLKRMVRANRRLGITSEIFFFYEGLEPKKTFFTKTYPKL